MKKFNLPKTFLKKVAQDTEEISKKFKSRKILPPKYNSQTYYKDLTKNEYFDALVTVRHYVK